MNKLSNIIKESIDKMALGKGQEIKFEKWMKDKVKRSRSGGYFRSNKLDSALLAEEAMDHFGVKVDPKKVVKLATKILEEYYGISAGDYKNLTKISDINKTANNLIIEKDYDRITFNKSITEDKRETSDSFAKSIESNSKELEKLAGNIIKELNVLDDVKVGKLSDVYYNLKPVVGRRGLTLYCYCSFESFSDFDTSLDDILESNSRTFINN